MNGAKAEVSTASICSILFFRYAGFAVHIQSTVSMNDICVPSTLMGNFIFE